MQMKAWRQFVFIKEMRNPRLVMRKEKVNT